MYSRAGAALLVEHVKRLRGADVRAGVAASLDRVAEDETDGYECNLDKELRLVGKAGAKKATMLRLRVVKVGLDTDTISP